MRLFLRLTGAAMAVGCVATAAFAQSAQPSRPVAVADITALASFGRGAISPDGRWAIYEKRGAYDSIPRFEFEWRSTWTIMDLWLVDLHDPAAGPQRLLTGEGPGLQRVAWSPSGARLLISRIRGERFEYGVVSMADRSVQWTGLTPDVQRAGASAAWLSDDRLVVLIRPDHSLPASMRYQGASQTLIPAAWERTAQGREPSRTVIDARDGGVLPETAPVARSLVMLDLAAGRYKTVASGGIADFAVSPAGDRIAITSAGGRADLSEPELVMFDSPHRHRLSILSLVGDAPSWTMEGRDVASGLLRWSPGSRAVLVWARRDGQPWSAGGLVQAVGPDVLDMKVDGLETGSTEAALGVHADWLGETPVLYARETDGGRHDWRLLSETDGPKSLTGALGVVPGQIAAAGPQALYLFADGGYWRLTRTGVDRLTAPGPVLGAAIVADRDLVARLKSNEAPRRSWAMAQDADGASLFVTEAGEAQRFVSMTGRPGQILAADPAGLLFLRRTGLSEDLILRTATAETRIDTVNGKFADVGLVEPEAISHLDIKGRETRSWLFLPRDGTPVRGLVIKVYPGSTDSLVWADPLTLTYAIGSQVFAGAGYAVLSPSIPTDGPLESRGEDIRRSVDLAVDAAIAACSGLPADRMAVLGHSFGGYAALEIASRSSRYRSYIASSAFSDMFGMWGEFDPATRILQEDGGMIRATQGWTEVGQGHLGAPPWAAPEAYAAASPYLRADRIRAPVLLLAADMDFVPLSQAERMFSALLRQGGEARLVTYWGEHHIFWSPANIRDRFTQILDWLDRTVTDPEIPGYAPDAAPSCGPRPRAPQPP